MKKVFIGLGIFFVLLIAAVFVLPIVFKDKIKAAIDAEIAKNVNANVYFSADKFGVSLFPHFPNLTASLNDFGVVGKDDFLGDTLVSVKAFQLTVNLSDLISGKIRIKSVDLESPRIQVIALKNGKANWDIYKADTTKKTTAEKPSDVSFGVDSWSLKNGYLSYDDRALNFYTRLENLNHTGKGDFAKNIFDMATRTQADKLTLRYGGVEYLTGKKADVDMTLGMDLTNAKYTFKENTAKLNDFAMGFDGYIAMPDTNIDMNMTFKTKETAFKTLLSLVPGVYTQSFKDLKADGNFAFDGYVKGIYNGKSMPGFGMNLLVNNGSFQYASLPVPVTNINVDMKVDNPTGVMENLLVDIKKFNLDMGKNPVKGKVLVKGLAKPNIDADITAKVNLAEMMQIYPMEGLTLRGLLDTHIKAQGVYDTLTQRIPAIDADFTLTNGYVKSKDFPAPLEQMFVKADVLNGSGRIADTKIHVADFRMLLENEPLEASAYIENLNDYTYDVKVKGTMDLTKITKIYPLKDMTLAGRVKADIATKGRMSDVTAKRYDKLPTSGTASISGFSFVSKDLPQGVKITEAAMEFSPKAVNLSKYEGFLGKSDVSMKGSLSDYIGFILGKGTVKGNLSFNSKRFNVNEWMTKNAAPDTTSAPMQVVAIPKNIDFNLSSSIGEIIYGNMDMKDVIGTVLVKNGVVTLDKLAFNMLGGGFVTSGSYDTQDLKHPKFGFDLGITNVSVQQAVTTFNTIKQMMPLAQSINGNFNTNFRIGGELSQTMMPVLSTLTGGGLVSLMEAVVKDAPVLNSLSSFTKLDDIKNFQLKDLIVNAKIENGRVNYKPFDVKAGNYKMNVSGGNGLDGSLDFKLKLDVPPNQVTNLAANALTQLTGKNLANQNVQLDLGVGGSYNKPTFKLLGSSTSQAAKEAITAKLDEEKEKLRLKAETEAKARLDQAKVAADKARADAEARIKAETDKIQAEADKKKAEFQAEADRKRKEIEANVQKQKEEARKRLEEEKKKALDNIFGKPKPADTTKKN
jgi:hypothetical protein